MYVSGALSLFNLIQLQQPALLDVSRSPFFKRHKKISVVIFLLFFFDILLFKYIIQIYYLINRNKFLPSPKF